MLQLLIICGVKPYCLHVIYKIELHTKKLVGHSELWKGAPNLKYLKVWGCLVKVMLPDPKKRKIGSETSDCMFIGYASNSVAYRFLALKSDVLE